jgi:hypothetical protein
VRERRDSYGIPISAVLVGSWTAEWADWTIGIYEWRGSWLGYYYGPSTAIYYMDTKTSALEVMREIEKALQDKGVKVFVNGRSSITLTSLLRFTPHW